MLRRAARARRARGRERAVRGRLGARRVSLLAGGLVDELHVFVAPRAARPARPPGRGRLGGPRKPRGRAAHRSPRWELCGTDAYVVGAARLSEESQGDLPRLTPTARAPRCGSARSGVKFSP